MAFKRTSSSITISTSITQDATNTFETQPIDLALNALDQEIFVVEAVSIHFESPFPQTGVFTPGIFASRDQIALSTSRPDTMPTLKNNNCLAASSRLTTYSVVDAVAPATVNTFGAFAVLEQGPADTPVTNLDYVGIVATSDMWLSVNSLNSLSLTGASVRVYGYRARADAATYAALVQSEVLSN